MKLQYEKVTLMQLSFS